MAEVGLVDWTHDHNSAQRIDTVTLGNVLLRSGISQTAEVQLGWTLIGLERQRDRASGVTSHSHGTGDLTVAVQQALGKSGSPAAIRAFVTLPTGNGPLGAGQWSGGAMIPLAFSISHRIELDLTPEVDGIVNVSGHGHHIAYGSVIGLGLSLTDKLSMALDATLFRDADPSRHTSRATAGASLAWMANRNLQLDAGTVTALNAHAPDLEAYFGVVRRF